MHHKTHAYIQSDVVSVSPILLCCVYHHFRFLSVIKFIIENPYIFHHAAASFHSLDTRTNEEEVKNNKQRIQKSININQQCIPTMVSAYNESNNKMCMMYILCICNAAGKCTPRGTFELHFIETRLQLKMK